MLEGYLLGIIVACTFVSAAFFFKFWRQTRDPLFMGFSVAFFIEACNRTGFLFVDSPADGNAFIYTIRLISYLVILFAIANKNRRSRQKKS